MGYGDEIMASGQAVALAAKGKRAAFTNDQRRAIIWSPAAHEIHWENPNVIPPGTPEWGQKIPDLEWVVNCKGHRPYAKQAHGRWMFRPFQPTPGRIVFKVSERAFANKYDCYKPFVVIEPRVKPMGACVGTNKQWPVICYAELAVRLKRDFNLNVLQLVPTGAKPLLGPSIAAVVYTPDFRHAAAMIKNADLYIGPEGGLHHAAAAVGTKAVVIFGGFANPGSTGYVGHANITAGGEPCGTIAACPHCEAAMNSISVEQVYSAAEGLLELGVPS